jgi:hypothetical protein
VAAIPPKNLLLLILPSSVNKLHKKFFIVFTFSYFYWQNF